jgi:hypothetical protein
METIGWATPIETPLFTTAIHAVSPVRRRTREVDVRVFGERGGNAASASPGASDKKSRQAKE